MLKTPPAPIALTVLGGFLGAGKTTLLNHLLRSQHHERLLVMVNDFGSINIDAALVAQNAPDLPDGIISLTNGCACCAIGGDLMQAFLQVLSLPQLPDRVLVEASGVGDPGRIAELGRAGGHFRRDGVITVVDAQAVQHQARDRYVGETVQAQLRAADLLLLNKTDLVAPQELSSLQEWLTAQAPSAAWLTSTFGVVDPRLILGPNLSAEKPFDSGPASSGSSAFDHDSRFISHTFASSRPLQRPLLEVALDTLPAHVMRAKGMVYLQGEDAPRLLQLSGRRWSIGPASPARGERRSRIVLIAARNPELTPFNPWSHFEGAVVD